MPAFPKIKLTYFDFTGRAEAARLAFYVGNIPFIDERLVREGFALSRKNNVPLGQLPVLEVDGQVLTQSEAILRFAGRLSGLYPVNAPLAALKVDEIIGGMSELIEQLRAGLRSKYPEQTKALVDNVFPRYSSLIDARLAELHKFPIFQATDKLFIHELLIYTWAKSLNGGYLDHVPATLDGDQYKWIQATMAKVDNHPKVKEYYSMEHNPQKLKLKLTYLPAPGRGEPIRLALFIGGIPFEDVRVPREEVPKLTWLPFGQLPVLEVDGEIMSQSFAILRYAGTLAGLYPSNDPVLAIRIDELLALVDEAINSWGPYHREKESAKQAEMQSELVSVIIPKLLGSLDKRVVYSCGPYAAGSEFTVADLAIYALYLCLKNGRVPGIPSEFLAPFENVQRVVDQVLAHPKVVEWNNVHPPILTP